MTGSENNEDAWFAPRAAAPPTASLADILRAMPGPVFAALDGGQFDDLPAELDDAKLKGRSLFLGVGDAETQKAGPWLADADSEAVLERLLAVIGDKPAAVFWSCPAGETALYRHLRGINEAIVPLPRPDAEARAKEAAAQGETLALRAADYSQERVLFRHWDPRVLCDVLPVLDEAQFAKVLGPAALVVIPREDGGKPFHAPALERVVIAPQGPLRLTIEQMQAISDARVAASRRRIADYLREVAPGETAGLDDRKLAKFVLYAEGTARGYSVETERATAIWTYMLVTSPNDFSQDWTIKRLMAARDPMTPDERVHHLFDARLQLLKGGK
jgi:Domain of unknown function (DUF4123)